MALRWSSETAVFTMFSASRSRRSALILSHCSGPYGRQFRDRRRRAAVKVATLVLVATCYCACHSGGNDPELEVCKLLDAEVTAPGVQLDVEEVFDEVLRTEALDPAYESGVPFLFVDAEGIAAFGNGSFVRTSLDGMSATPVPYVEYRSPRNVVQADGFYGVIATLNSGRRELCIHDNNGTLENCSLAFGEEFTWRTPSFYFPSARPAFPPDDTINLRTVNRAGIETEEFSVLPQDGERTSSFALRPMGDKFALFKWARKPEDPDCSSVYAATVGKDIDDASWRSTTPESFEPFGGILTSGGGSVAILHRAWYCHETVFECSLADYGYPPLLTIVSDTSASFAQVHGPQFDGTHIVWDGEAFAIFKITDRYRDMTAEPEVTITRVAPDGRIIGTATWPHLFSLMIGGVGFAAVGPSDYVFAMGVQGPDGEFLDRILRVRLSTSRKP